MSQVAMRVMVYEDFRGLRHVTVLLPLHMDCLECV